MKLQLATWKKKQKYHDDGGEGYPVSAVVSQGNYEVTNGQLKKNRNIMMMMGVRAVLSLQWCLRGTLKLKMATWKENRNIMMMMGMRAVLSLQWCLRGTMKLQMATWKKKKYHYDGGEGCPVSAVLSQGNYEVTNGQLKKKKKHHDDDGGEGCPVSAVVSQGNYEDTTGHLENGHLEKNRNIMMMMG